MPATAVPEWITAIATLALAAFGFLGLRSLRIAATALELEANPVIVIEPVKIQERPIVNAERTSVTVRIENQLPALEDEDTVPTPPTPPGARAAAYGDDLLPNVTVRVRNVGRSPAVGLRLLAHVAVAGATSVLPITLPFVGTGSHDERFIRIRNNTPGTVMLTFFSIAHHQPEDAPGYLHLRGKWAMRLRLWKMPRFASTRLYRSLMKRMQAPHRRVYVYCPNPISVRAPGH